MKHSTKIVRRGLVCITALLLTTSAAIAQEYSINLSRPEKVNDQYTTTIKSKFSRSIGGNTESYTVELHGTVKVQAVNEKVGTPTKITLTIEKATKDGNELVPSGSVITAEKVGKDTTFTVGDAPADENVKGVLDTLFDLASPDGQIDADASFGTDKQKKVGDTWPINGEMMAKDSATNAPFTITADQVKGDSALVEVKKIDGVEVMLVKTVAKIDVDHQTMQGADISDVKINLTSTGTLPVDKSMPLRSMVTVLKMKMNVNPPGAPAPIAFEASQEKTEDRTPVKP